MADAPEIDVPDEVLTVEDICAAYPVDMIDEIDLPQPEGGHVSLNGGTTAGVVYVVVHYDKEPDILNNINIMGTYSTVELANLRVLSVFREKYPQHLRRIRNGDLVDGDAHWYHTQDEYGAIRIWFGDDEGSCMVDASRQVVQNNALQDQEAEVAIFE
ncbi:hypothetical protein F5Y04DRAFT_239465 [Hypomontagnella monticulosa]|nr:hypothetical protein F5Y04DRAFT_239465 [Hypomontagnella monticulosa]